MCYVNAINTNIHIPCISGDNGFTSVLDSSLNSRWQHCLAVFLFLCSVFSLGFLPTEVSCFTIREKVREIPSEVQMVTYNAHILYRFSCTESKLKWVLKNQNHQNSSCSYGFFLSLFISAHYLFVLSFFTVWSKDDRSEICPQVKYSEISAHL